MKRPVAILIIVLILAYCGGRLSYHWFAQTKSDSPPESTPVVSAEPSSLPAEPTLAPSFEVEAIMDDSFSPPEDIAFSDELLVSFDNDSSYQRFLENAAREGINVMRANDRLRSARVGISDESEADRVRAIAGEDAQFDYNYIVAAPTTPQPSVSGQGNQAFNNQALAWLGVPDDHSTWGAGITVAILDTGISSHSSLDGVEIERISLIDDNAQNGRSEYSGHGTAVASIIAGSSGTGIAPASDLISIQVMDSDGLGDSFTLAEGIIRAVDSGAEVISMSLGSYGYTRALQDAVDYAHSKNVALVASVGNDGSYAAPYPAQLEGVIGVSAVDAESQRAAFSNYSSAVDIGAPGVGVYAAWNDNDWTRFSGTSAAAPYVSGTIAATLSLDSKLNPVDAAEIVLDYADDASAPGIDIEVGQGILNLDRVVNRDESHIFDAALADFYLDLDQANESTIPLLVNVQNRGTERLNNVSVIVTENDGIPQRVYLGSLMESETTSHTIYLDPSQLMPEAGYTIFAETVINGPEDSRAGNDARSGSLQLQVPDP